MSYKIEENLKVGDTVYMAAPDHLLRAISISPSGVRSGEVYTIEELVDDNGAWNNRSYRGSLHIRSANKAFWIPYSHWKEFLIKT